MKTGLGDQDSNTYKQRRRQTRAQSKSKYLSPGALAQLRHTKWTTTRACTDLGKKRVALSVLKNTVHNDTHLIMSPRNLVKQNWLPKTPVTPRSQDCNAQSRLESLPPDILVKIVCHMHHDQLSAVFHVSQRVRMAVIFARQFHFNYTTPARSHQEFPLCMTPVATEHWPFRRKSESMGFRLPSPNTPKAPRHGPRVSSRLKCTEMRLVAAVLFQETPLRKPSSAL